MFWSEPVGTWKYSPAISAEKITETSSDAFLQLCRTEAGREMAIKILDNYTTKDEQGTV